MEDDPISRKQIARIWAAAHDLALDRQALYALVPGGSISRLNRKQAAALIEALDRLSANEGRPTVPADAQPKREPAAWQATEAQRALIRSLFQRLGWHADPRRERGFLRKFAHVERLEDLASRRKAIALIEALKAILARQQGRVSQNSRAGSRNG